MKPKHQRLIFVGVSAIFLCVSVLFGLRAFRENLIFFYSPSEIDSQSLPLQKRIRVGGLVENGSVKHGADNGVSFSITDGKQAIEVEYHGLLPSLFREGQGVVAQGKLTAAHHLQAETILAKHDENYMPREVVDALKRSGQWKGQ